MSVRPSVCLSRAFRVTPMRRPCERESTAACYEAPTVGGRDAPTSFWRQQHGHVDSRGEAFRGGGKQN